MRALTSLAALILAGSALAQAFGRFGYADAINVPGLRVGRDGFVAKATSADAFRFLKPSKQWKPIQTTEYGQTVMLSQFHGCPGKLRASLFTPGASLYFPDGMDLKLGSTGSPFLSWSNGTAGAGVPTPESKWVLVSFKQAQPPILLVFLDGPTSVKVTGKAGDWTLSTDKAFKGWVRVATPLGGDSTDAGSAAALGQLCDKVTKEEPFWTSPDVKLEGVQLDADNTAVQATWHFDRPGAVVPMAAALASVGGYPIRILSKTHRLESADNEGPVTITDEPDLTLRFPVRRVPTGRAVVVGSRLVPNMGTASPFDIPSVAEMALENLLSDRDTASRKAADDTLAAYLLEADYVAEPFTGQQLPYTAEGVGIDLAAAHALLMQAITNASEASSEDNSLLTSVAWRRDWYTWKVWAGDPAVSRRASALAALAGALCPEPQRRLDAAMLEAGLAAERGLAILKARAAHQPEPKLMEPLSGLRRTLFFMTRKVAEEDPFARSLISEVRVFGDIAIRISPPGEDGRMKLAWSAEEKKPGVLTMAGAFPIELANGNLEKFDPSEALGFSRVLYVPAAPGPCEIWLTIPAWAKPLPTAAAVPRYSEEPR